jgi:hypothetical protein
MARYAAPFTKTNADSVQQLVEVLSNGSTAHRTWWDCFIVAKTASPADSHHSFIVRRVTASATGTSLTPTPLESNDAASRATAEHIITADHASFASGVELFRAPLNDRATYTFYANPGQELVGPATTSNGLSLGLGTASTGLFGGTVYFKE